LVGQLILAQNKKGKKRLLSVSLKQLVVELV
jgi:hypothetical protein